MSLRWHKIPDIEIDGVEIQFAVPDKYEAGTVRLFAPTLQPLSLVSEDLPLQSVTLGIVPLPGDQWFLVYSVDAS